MVRSVISWLSLLLICFHPSTGQTRKIERLRDIQTIYVDKLGDSDGSKMIREKIINRLVESKRFSVVDEPAQADVILTGAAEAHESFGVVNGTGHTSHISTVAVRLLTQDKRILWVKEAKTGKWVWSDDADEKLVKELLNAIKKDEKGKE